MKKGGLSFWFCHGPKSGESVEGLPDDPSTAHGARCAATTELRWSRCWLLRRSRCWLLRRSRCCDGAAQTSSVALILRVATRPAE